MLHVPKAACLVLSTIESHRPLHKLCLHTCLLCRSPRDQPTKTVLVRVRDVVRRVVVTRNKWPHGAIDTRGEENDVRLCCRTIREVKGILSLGLVGRGDGDAAFLEGDRGRVDVLLERGDEGCSVIHLHQ